MNVVRVEKNKDYSVISNAFLRDKQLSYQAKGLLANIMTHSDEYEFSINGVVATSQEEKTAIYTIIKELIKQGYATRQQERVERGFGKVTYTFFESKNAVLSTSGLLSASLDAGNVDTGIVDTQNQPQRSTNKKEITKIRNNKDLGVNTPDLEIPDFDFSGEVTLLFLESQDVLRTPIGKKTNSGAAAIRAEKAEKFNTFWDKYKKKKAVEKCRSKWMTLSMDDIEAILACVDDHVIITPELQYRKHPITWLNGRCWEDDISEELKKFKPRSKKPQQSEGDNDWF